MSIPHSKFASVCSYTFTDGRHCRTPRSSRQSLLCAFHAQKQADAEKRQHVGYKIGTWVTTEYLSACDLGHALGLVFSQTLQGNIKPKTAATLAYLGQTMLQTIQVAQHEYINAHGAEGWRDAIRCATSDPARAVNAQTENAQPEPAQLEEALPEPGATPAAPLTVPVTVPINVEKEEPAPSVA